MGTYIKKKRLYKTENDKGEIKTKNVILEDETQGFHKPFKVEKYLLIEDDSGRPKNNGEKKSGGHKINHEPDNIRNLNLLTVNYIQRKALLYKPKLFEHVTNIIKDIKKILAEEVDPEFIYFPPIPSKPPIIPEFLVDLNNSDFMSQVCTPVEIFDDYIDKEDNHQNRFLKILMFAISINGEKGDDLLKKYHENINDNTLDKLLFSLFNNEFDEVIKIYKKKISDPEKKYFVALYRNTSDFEKWAIYKDDEEIVDVLLCSIPKKTRKESIKHEKLADIVRMNKSLKLIKRFSSLYGNYDAYSLTVYHNVEYYIDLFAEIIKTNKENKGIKQVIVRSLYPKCFHQSDYITLLKNQNGYCSENLYNIYDGKTINYESEFKRFIGLLIWDVHQTKKYSLEESINKVKEWYNMKYGVLEIDISDEMMMKLYYTAKQCINEGQYLIRDSKTGKHYKPNLK